jgi:hypothetical protein
MNIISIENTKRFNSFSNKVEISSNYKYSDNKNYLLILNDDDINNDNCIIKLRGYSISCLLIPKRYRFTFFDETPIGKIIRRNLTEDFSISYY